MHGWLLRLDFLSMSCQSVEMGTYGSEIEHWLQLTSCAYTIVGISTLAHTHKDFSTLVLFSKTCGIIMQKITSYWPHAHSLVTIIMKDGHW